MKRLSARVRANRRNSLRSTLPRTPAGKARASKNAFKHGLAASHVPPELGVKASIVAAALSGRDAGALCYELAREFAEAQADVKRVRGVEQVILDQYARRLDEEVRTDTFQDLVEALRPLPRYERRALSRRNKAHHALEKLSGQPCGYLPDAG